LVTSLGRYTEALDNAGRITAHLGLSDTSKVIEAYEKDLALETSNEVLKVSLAQACKATSC
jgi:hypothetical protein